MTIQDVGAVQVWDVGRTKDELARFARAVNDGQLDHETVLHSIIPLVVPEWVERPADLFAELMEATRNLDEWSAAADLGLAHRWASEHGLSPSDLTVGSRLASEVEALLSRLVGGVA